MAMVFKDSFTAEEYSELRECLCNKRILLLQAFKDFENLPNLHASFHLLLHAKNYATLLNTSVGTKEMVHRLFKNIVPQTNLKNVSLDLLKNYTTLFAIRHLLDGGIDLRLSTLNSGFMNLPKHLRRLMSNWFIITKDNIDINDDASEVMVLKVYSPDEQISNILLKKRIFRRNVVISPLLNIYAELKLAYEDLGDDSVILDITPSFFEFASFIFENERDNTILRHLHIGDVVSINFGNGNNFVIIRAIFCHQKNDLRFAFVIVDWFEELNRTRLGCPMYQLQMTHTNQRRVFSISLVNAINIVHFVHCCKDEECIEGDHNSKQFHFIHDLEHVQLDLE
ncbi:hypothetical protein GLOIN_2v1474421 [Rhizophagus irregularis DAOM 181602=DAOM 197198]|nr:hypothetical protein GLOIN_2v1474421 [Rhizophagus irregularis DAOM 181602=DAOM 197198]